MSVPNALSLTLLVAQMSLAALLVATPAGAQDTSGCVNAEIALAEKSWNATEALPGGTVIGEYEATLDGDGSCNKTVTFAATFDNTSWSTSVDVATADLCAGDLCSLSNPGNPSTKIFNVTVTVPAGAPASETAEVTVRAFVDGDEELDASQTKNLSAGQTYVIHAICGGDDVVVRPGGTTYFEAMGHNGGNGEDTARITASAPEGITATPNPASGSVMANMMVTANVTVEVASGVKAGDYDVDVSFTSAGDTSQVDTCTQTITVQSGGGGGGDGEEESPGLNPLPVAIIVAVAALLRRRRA